MPRNQSEITTYHEAGHAVMALASGFIVTEMSNVPSAEGLGYVAWRDPPEQTTESRIKSALVLASGLAADFLHASKCDPNTNVTFTGHLGDQHRASDYLSELNHSGHFDIYVQVAIRFLGRPDVWIWVEGFAELLTMAGTINGDDLLYRASQNVPKLAAHDFDFLQSTINAVKSGMI